jgi:hypothetical protein
MREWSFSILVLADTIRAQILDILHQNRMAPSMSRCGARTERKAGAGHSSRNDEMIAGQDVSVLLNLFQAQAIL